MRSPILTLRPAQIRIWRLGLALAISIVISGTSQADDLDEVTAASDSLQTVIGRALADEDSDLLASVFTEDGAVISPNGRVVRGRMTLKASAALLFMTMGSGDIEIDRHNLSLIDDTGYETGRFVFKRSGEEANRATFAGSYTAVWQREAGRWKLAVIVGLR
jgi:uncharacterized protein (TIGR02246 family)